MQKIKAVHLQDQYNWERFRINGSSVELIDQQPFWNQFIFDAPIKPEHNGQFTIKIQKTNNRLIMVGVIDYEARKGQLYSHDSDYFMALYYGLVPKVHPAGGFQGTGFKEGDNVEVKVNRGIKKISWWINGQKQAELEHNMLTRNVILMPFVEMNETSDVVKWEDERFCTSKQIKM